MADHDTAEGRALRRREQSKEYEAVALRMFAKSGFGNVTVEDIAKAAGVSTRTLFRYFPTKDDFLLAMPRRSSEELRDALAAIGSTDDPVGAVWDTFIVLSAKHIDDLDGVVLWSQAAKGAPEVLAQSAGERAAAISDMIRKICAASFGWGESGDVRPRALAAAIGGALGEVYSYWVERGGQDNLESLYRASMMALKAAMRSA